MPYGIVVVVLIALLLFSTFRVLNEYERGVMLTLGRFTGVKGPGIVIVFPILQQMRKVDLRVIVLNVPKQDVITRDNVSVKVNAVVYFRVVDPEKAIIQVANPFEATSQVAQTTLRSVLGNTRWMTCWRSATSSTPISRSFSIRTPRPGESRCPMSRSRTWTSTKA